MQLGEVFRRTRLMTTRMSIDFSKGCAIAYGMVDFEYLFKLYTTTINLDLDEDICCTNKERPDYNCRNYYYYCYHYYDYCYDFLLYIVIIGGRRR